MKTVCPLCADNGTIFYQFKKKLFHQCSNCSGIFMDPTNHPTPEKEKLRYEEHNNDTEDKGYQNFVSPITKAILKDFEPRHKGLDFGAGTAPVISKILTDHNFQIKQYDPYFHSDTELLKTQYDYIACCEVIEHFNNPYKEFKLLKNLLLPHGKLYCMTDLYDESIDFHKWYYKNDQTHVFIYHEKTIEWIKEEFNFSEATINGRLVTFSR
jgi:SAM-dependent methyltransferase